MRQLSAKICIICVDVTSVARPWRTRWETARMEGRFPVKGAAMEASPSRGTSESSYGGHHWGVKEERLMEDHGSIDATCGSMQLSLTFRAACSCSAAVAGVGSGLQNEI